MPGNFFLFAASAFIISSVAMPLIIKFSHKHGIFDYTNSRKVHTGDISRLGGLGIFIAFLPLSYYYLEENHSGFNHTLFFSGLIIAFIVGFADDLVSIRARYKLLFQIAAAGLAAASGLLFNDFRFYTFFYLDFGYMAYPITIFWIIAFMNAVNLIDGMDGLSTGIFLIANLFIIIISAMIQNYHVLMLSLILECSIAGFYIFNFPPAKIFLGDGGAYFIGFVYAVMPLMGVKKSAALTVFLIPMILMLVPIMDVIQVMFRRLKNGHNMFHPDNNHLHHRLMNLGFSTKGILSVVYVYTAILGVFSLIMVSVKPEYTMILFGFILMMLVISIVVLKKAESVISELKNKNDFNNKVNAEKGKDKIVLLRNKTG